ncbi:MAG: glycosyltransferase involved in cell wall biosynthesis [Verrucomicrobiales bacterium]|jgi:glycosyltransferase involved in cell wall biosynthesis
MKLAVIIPCYNHERYIAQGLESVLGQTRPPDRVLVIDDGSKDASVEVIKTFADRGVELIVQENAGAHNTINRAVALAAEDCDVISILNSDDHYFPQRFEKCLAELEKNPDKSVVCSEICLVDDDGNPVDPQASRPKWFQAIWSIGDDPEVDFCEWMATANFPATTSNVIARREFLLAHPFRPYRFNHDYYFLANAVLKDQFLLVREPLVSYRIHASNTINTSPAPLIKEMLRMHADLYHDLAPQLRADAALRSRFYRYTRAAWNNVSSFHAGLFQSLLAQATAQLSHEKIDALVAGLDEQSFPEFAAYPNKALVNNHQPGKPLSVESGLAEKFDSLRAEKAEWKERAKAEKELSRLRRKILASKWLTFGRALGLCCAVTEDRGKSPQEKLANLRAALEKSWWANLGPGIQER